MPTLMEPLVPKSLGLLFPSFFLCLARHVVICASHRLPILLMPPNLESLQFSVSREQNFESLNLCVCVCTAQAGFWMLIFCICDKRVSSPLITDFQMTACFLPCSSKLLLHLYYSLALSGLICSGDYKRTTQSILVCGFLFIAKSVTTCLPAFHIAKFIEFFCSVLSFFLCGYNILFLL